MGNTLSGRTWMSRSAKLAMNGRRGRSSMNWTIRSPWWPTAAPPRAMPATRPGNTDHAGRAGFPRPANDHLRVGDRVLPFDLPAWLAPAGRHPGAAAGDLACLLGPAAERRLRHRTPLDDAPSAQVPDMIIHAERLAHDHEVDDQRRFRAGAMDADGRPVAHPRLDRSSQGAPPGVVPHALRGPSPRRLACV